MELHTWRTRCVASGLKLYRSLSEAFSAFARVRANAPLAGRWIILLGLLGAGLVHAATYVYDSNGRLRAVTNASNASGRYVYDALGNLLRVDQLPAGQLAIFTFSPSHGAPGIHVVISGQGFSSTIASDAVRFNGAVAVVTAATATQLTATVPSGATTGKITVTVGTQTATSDDTFVVDTTGLSPTITSVTPLIGGVGTSVTVNGTHLDPILNQTTPAINGWKTVLSSAIDSQVQFAVPINAGSGKVSITTPYGMASSSSDFVVTPAGISAANVASTQRMTLGSQAAVTIPAGKYGAVLFDAATGAWLSFQVSGLSSSAGTISYAIYDNQNRAIASGVIQSVGLSIHLPQLKMAGTYSIWIMPNTASASMTLALGTDQVMSLNVPMSLNVATRGQDARVIFTATATQTIALVASSVTTVPSNVNVFYTVDTPDGLPYASRNVYGNTTINLPNITKTGTYQLYVIPAVNATLSAQLELLSGVTGTLTNGITKQIAATAPGLNVYLNFTVSSVGSYGLGISGLSSSPDHYVNVNVYDAYNSNVASNSNCLVSNGGCGLDMQNLAVGKYHVIISPPDVDSISFGATLSKDLTGTLALNTPKSAVLVPGQTATMTLAATAGQTLVIQASGATIIPASHSISFTVYAPNGNQVAATTQWSDGDAAVNLPNLPVTGMYKVYIAPGFGAALTEQKLELLPGITGTLAINGSSQSFATAVVGQNVYLNFVAAPGDNLGLGISALSILPNNGGSLSINVYDSNNNFVGSAGNCLVSNGGCGLNMRNLTGGTYQVIASTSYFQTTGFTAALTRDVTGTLPLSTPQPVNLMSPGEAAEFTFTATAGQTLALQATSVSSTPSGALVSYSVYAPNGTLYRSFSSAGSVQGNLPNLLTAGTYRVNISVANGATLSEQLELLPPKTGVLTINGASQNFATTVPGAGVYLNFTAAAGDNLNVTITGFNAYPDYTALALVFDANNNQITGSNCTVTGNGCVLNMQNLASGTYQVRIAPYNGEYDTMSFDATLSRQ